MKYYMSFDSLVVVDGETPSKRFEQAKQKFIDLLNSDIVEIVCVNEEEDDEVEE